MTLLNLRKKKSQSARPSYPQTRELFLFARQVLASRRGEQDPSRLMDTEVGALLDYDYKYTHQWRFGKKRMFDTAELMELSDNLDVPFAILQKIAIGVWDADQGFAVLGGLARNTARRIRRTLRADGVSVEVEVAVPEERVAQVERVLDGLKDKLRERRRNSGAFAAERQEEIQQFDAFVDDLDLPRVSFYRKTDRA